MEPEVWTSDVRDAVLTAKRRMAIPLIAELARTSERTIYRVIDGEYERLMELELADQILMACDGDLAFCHLEWEDGRVQAP